MRDASYRFHCERFDSFDGLPGPSEDKFPFPKATKGTDGRLWFTATRGVAWIDPKGIRRINTVPPPVHIEQIVDNGREYAVSNGLRLPPHVRDLSISYAGLSLAVPEKVHFRYKLDGQDPAWREVINDRRVQYSNLSPGDYHFHVIACNNDGVWNETGASLDFSILPAYYQTAWFRALCGAAILLLLWTIYQIRLRRLHHQFTIGMEARVNERMRIARDLHDTLLQSFQGAVYQFQAARKLLIRNAENAMQVVDEAIHVAEAGITEGRAAIHDLRPEPASQRDLLELLRATGHELTDTHQSDGDVPTFRVILEGKQRDLNLVIQNEVYRISREVIRNAFAHAEASHIEAEVHYDDNYLRVRVRDDGNGIDPSVFRGGGPPGHWGIPGMRERAKEIGSRLDFWGEKCAGTEVQLTVPAAVAYQRRRPGRRFRLFHSGGSDEQRS